MRKLLAPICAIAISLSAGMASAEHPRARAALDILASFASGDASGITAGIDPDHYRQHNPMMPDGREAILKALPMIKSQGTAWHPVRVIVDGDLVAVHSDAHFMGADMVAFDVFRFQGDRVVEHWDNLQPKAGPNPSGHGMTDGTTEITDLDRTAANKALVDAFLHTVLMRGEFARMPEFISSTTYTQHNPMVADGMEGLQKAGPILAKFRYLSIEKLIGQGNMVLAMSHVSFDGTDTAAYDLFRVKDGRIVEHWDVVATIPPGAEWHNPNGKF